MSDNATGCFSVMVAWIRFPDVQEIAHIMKLSSSLSSPCMPLADFFDAVYFSLITFALSNSCFIVKIEISDRRFLLFNLWALVRFFNKLTLKVIKNIILKEQLKFSKWFCFCVHNIQFIQILINHWFRGLSCRTVLTVPKNIECLEIIFPTFLIMKG